MAWAGRERPYEVKQWCGASLPSEPPRDWNPVSQRTTYSKPPPLRSRWVLCGDAAGPECLPDADDSCRQEFLSFLERIAALYGELQAENQRLHDEIGNGHCNTLDDAPNTRGSDPGSSTCSTILPLGIPMIVDSVNSSRQQPMSCLSPLSCTNKPPIAPSVSPVAVRLKVASSKSGEVMSHKTTRWSTDNGKEDHREREVRRQYKRLLQKAAKKNHTAMEEVDFLMGNPDQSCVDVVRAVNSCLGRTDAVETMDNQTYQCLMSSEDLEEMLSPEVYERACEIRRVLREDELNKIVSSHAYVGVSDLLSVEQGQGSPKGSLLLRVLDPVSFLVIVINALLLAVSADVEPDWYGWELLEYSFTCFFVFELLCKTNSRGIAAHFLGESWRWNVADFLFVLFALTDAVLQLVTTSNSDLQLFTIMRLVRLCRMTRLIRLLRFKIFKELMLMIQGIMAGLRTLVWAIFLLLFVIFCLGMVMRQTLGKWCLLETDLCGTDHLKEYGQQLFSTVARSCFTVFRCFTEGCASVDGTPLLIHIYDNGLTGQLMVFLYMLCFLAVTFGLFNLIMAVFVENTIESAKQDERKRHQARQKDYNRIAKKLQRVVLQFVSGNDSSRVSSHQLPAPQGGLFNWFSREQPNEELGASETSMETEVTREMFGRVIEDPMMASLLEDMEVCIEDPMSLFDTLDADESGALDVAELSNGIMKLRGEATKSDTVASLLSVRATHRTLRNLDRRLDQDGEVVRAQNRELVRRLQALEERLVGRSSRWVPPSPPVTTPPPPSTPRRHPVGVPEHV